MHEHNIDHSSEKLKVTFIKPFLFFAKITYQFKTSELKNVEKLVEQTAQAFKVLLEWTGNVHFCTICEIKFLVGGPWKLNVVLGKSSKKGCNFLYEPWWGEGKKFA